MFNQITKNAEPLEINPLEIELVIDGNGLTPFMFILPPLEDIAKISELKNTNFSLKEHKKQIESNLFIPHSDISALKSKQARFNQSTKYYTRLANLSHLLNDYESELKYLKVGKSLSENDFFDKRIGEFFISQSKFDESEEIFSKLDLKNDLHANLRLSFFSILRNDFERASSFIQQALIINPLSSGARLVEGMISLFNSECEQAIRSFRIAADERPNSATVYKGIGIAQILLGQPEKALKEFKKAVSLDPLNEKNVALLADLTAQLGCHEKAIPSLKLLIQYEQKNPELWERLARATYFTGQYEDALHALRAVGSLNESAATWNNIGAVYMAQKKNKLAENSLLYSLTKAQSEESTFFTAAMNLCQIYVNENRLTEAVDLSTKAIENDKDYTTLTNDQFTDLWILKIHSLWRLHKEEEAIDTVLELLKNNNITPRLKTWVASGLIAKCSIINTLGINIESLIKDISETAVSLDKAYIDFMDIFNNNVAFYYAERGNINEALNFISKIRNIQSPYPLATLGLIHLRKGNFEKGIGLYELAIHIATNKPDKIRIRQKLNYEYGLHYNSLKSYNKAIRYFDKVIEEKNGLSELILKAKEALSKTRALTIKNQN